MDSVVLYKLAYELHYTDQNLNEAVNLYRRLIEQFPHCPEAEQARAQLRNIEAHLKKLSFKADNPNSAPHNTQNIPSRQPNSQNTPPTPAARTNYIPQLEQAKPGSTTNHFNHNNNQYQNYPKTDRSNTYNSNNHTNPNINPNQTTQHFSQQNTNRFNQNFQQTTSQPQPNPGVPNSPISGTAPLPHIVPLRQGMQETAATQNTNTIPQTNTIPPGQPSIQQNQKPQPNIPKTPENPPGVNHNLTNAKLDLLATEMQKHRGGVATVLSAIFPGLGQLYSGESLLTKGIAFLSFWLMALSFYIPVYQKMMTDFSNNGLIGIFSKPEYFIGSLIIIIAWLLNLRQIIIHYKENQ